MRKTLFFILIAIALLILFFFFIPTKNFKKNSLPWWSLKLNPEFSFDVLLNHVGSEGMEEGVFSFSDMDGLKPQRASMSYLTPFSKSKVLSMYKNKLSEKQCTTISIDQRCASYICKKPDKNTISICIDSSSKNRSEQQVVILVEA